MLKVSIIIPAYNEENSIINLLNLLHVESVRKPDEIVVVDANSSDRTVELVKAWKSDNESCSLKLVELKSQAYPGAGRNKGVDSASYELIAFIDCGIIPDKNWLNELVKAFEADGSLDVTWGKSYSKALSDWERVFAAVVEPKTQVSRIVRSSCIKKDAFYKVGMFRGELRAAEDLLYIKAIEENGLREAFVSSAEAWYSGYPKSYFQAYKKWALYTEHTVYSGLYKRKLLLSFILLFGILGAGAAGYAVLNNMLGALVTALLAYSIRVLTSIKRSSSYIQNLKEFLWAFGISAAIDAGRIAGLIKGLESKNEFHEELQLDEN